MTLIIIVCGIDNYSDGCYLYPDRSLIFSVVSACRPDADRVLKSV